MHVVVNNNLEAITEDLADKLTSIAMSEMLSDKTVC
jgi:hypothetical protein